MDSGDLSVQQLEQIQQALDRHINYLARLKDRMEQRSFPTGDPLYMLTVKAYDAALSLSKMVHRMSSGGKGDPFGWSHRRKRR
jgi:ribosomal protein L16/L10AE